MMTGLTIMDGWSDNFGRAGALGAALGASSGWVFGASFTGVALTAAAGVSLAGAAFFGGAALTGDTAAVGFGAAVLAAPPW